MPEPRKAWPFTRAQRLVKAPQYRNVFENARRSSDRFFTVLATDNETGHPRLGMAIGKKRIRRAVSRNRVKRLIRESFRANASHMVAVDLVVISRFNGVATNKAINDSLSRHWARFSR